MTALPPGSPQPGRQLEERLREGQRVLAGVARRVFQRLGGLVDRDDLESLGRPALLAAARSFDPARGTFAAYVAARVRSAMVDGVRRETHGRTAAARAHVLAGADRACEFHSENEPRDAGVVTQEEGEASLDQLLDGQAAALALGVVAYGADLDLTPGSEESPEDRFLRKESLGRLDGALEGLPERERVLIRRYYFEEGTLEGIARELGVSTSWASRLHAQALESLARALGRAT